MAAARLRALWEHPAGIKTVFFWAPTMKWGLVLASLSDMKRPVEDVSIPQCSALALTGMVWSTFKALQQRKYLILSSQYISIRLLTSHLILVCFITCVLQLCYHTARWSFVIIPLNYNLAGANIFVALTNMYQLSRVARHRFGSSEKKGLAGAIEQ